MKQFRVDVMTWLWEYECHANWTYSASCDNIIWFCITVSLKFRQSCEILASIGVWKRSSKMYAHAHVRVRARIWIRLDIDYRMCEQANTYSIAFWESFEVKGRHSSTGSPSHDIRDDTTNCIYINTELVLSPVNQKNKLLQEELEMSRTWIFCLLLLCLNWTLQGFGKCAAVGKL